MTKCVNRNFCDPQLRQVQSDGSRDNNNLEVENAIFMINSDNRVNLKE